VGRIITIRETADSLITRELAEKHPWTIKNYNSSAKAKSIPIAIGTAMAVYHCRCAFLSFFLLHRQKKEH
jgi:hypothetical protein